MKLNFLVKISRPKQGLYLLYSYALGLIAGYQGALIHTPGVILAGVFFALLASFLADAVELLFDYPLTGEVTDKKLQTDSPTNQRNIIYLVLVLIGLFTAVLLLTVNWYAWFGLIVFLLLNIFYSAAPIRAKNYPIMANLFNVRYALPAIVGFSLIADQFPPFRLVLVSFFWCMAIQALLATETIKEDQKRHHETVATTLGLGPTLAYCLVCYLAAGFLLFEWLSIFAVLAVLLYAGLVLVMFYARNKQLSYQFFRIANLIFAIALFLWVLLVVK